MCEDIKMLLAPLEVAAFVLYFFLARTYFQVRVKYQKVSDQKSHKSDDYHDKYQKS